MEKLEWLQAFAEPEQPETGAAAPTPEQQERLAALSPEGTQALTQEQREAVQAVAQAEAPRVLIYHTHTYEAYQATETENYKPTEKWRTREMDEFVRVAKLADE